MKFKNIVLFALMLLYSNVNAQIGGGSRIHELNQGWRFSKDLKQIGMNHLQFDDSSWRVVQIPHDWSIEDLPNQSDTVVGPFAKNAVSGFNTGFTMGGTAWYRKHFKLDKKEKDKLVYLCFDGIYMNSDVWINGHHLGNHPNGYTPFYYDVTSYLSETGEDNLIAVEVKNEGVNSRWYSGSGIAREAWLEIVPTVHVDVWGVYVTTPIVGKNKADVQADVTINNQDNEDKTVNLVIELIDSKGKIVATTDTPVQTVAKKKTTVTKLLTVSNPDLWSPKSPSMYRARVRIVEKKKNSDSVSVPFGIREIKVDAANGLLINGVPTLLYGGCIHHDNGPIGAIDIERAVERKLEILKANGFNAVRTAHNPFSRTFLNVCDRMGMLVMDEAFDMWNNKKTEDDYSQYFQEWHEADLTNILMRDRNHPSVIFWSIGNEIRERVDSLGYATRHQLKEIVKSIDSTRFVTEGINRTPKWERRTPEAFADLDVCGYNYQWTRFEEDHEKYPNRVMVTTESYPNQADEAWSYVEKYPYVIGDFVWTAVDYMGEAGLGVSEVFDESGHRTTIEWPMYNANCGDIDLIGNKKPQSYYRDVVWGRSKVEMFVRKPVPQGKEEFISWWGWPDVHHSWSWPGMEGDTLQVDVYSLASEIKLFLNGKEIMKGQKPQEGITFSFRVPYVAGELVAKAYENEKEVGIAKLKTTGMPAAIRLTPDRHTIAADKLDLAYISVEVVDGEGHIIPYADDISINFELIGDAELAAVGNSNFKGVASMRQPVVKVFHGRALAVVRSTGMPGRVVLKATSKELNAGEVNLFIK
jgi:beta-galactosidase